MSFLKKMFRSSEIKSTEKGKSITTSSPSTSQPVDPLAEFGYRFSGSDSEVFNMDPSMTYKTDFIQQYDNPNSFFKAMSMGTKLGLFKGSSDKACIVYSEKYPIGDRFKVLFTVNSKPPHTMVMCISRETIRDFQESDRCLGVFRDHFYIMRI